MDAVTGSTTEAARLRDFSTYSGFVIPSQMSTTVFQMPMYATIAQIARVALNAANAALPQLCALMSRHSVNSENATIASGAMTYSSGEAVRFLTFGVRANGIFLPLSDCWIDLSTPARLTGNRMRLKP